MDNDTRPSEAPQAMEMDERAETLRAEGSDASSQTSSQTGSRAGSQANSQMGSRTEHEIAEHIREGRFQRSLSLLAGVSSLVTGLEVAYEHYRGSYSRRVMYTPLATSALLTGVAVAAFFSGRAARKALRPVALVTLANGGIGFYFHVRGIARKPGGWRFPMTNIVMGPPIFAPLLFGLAAYLGLIASYLRREEEEDRLPEDVWWVPRAAHSGHWMTAAPHEEISKPETIGLEQDLREGRFQKHMAAAAALSAFFSGFEAFYSHYKNNFQYKAQWTPIILAPMLMTASLASIRSRKVAHTWLPALSTAAVLDGSVGFFYHARGVLRRPGGRKHLLYNIMYGPPIFAPMLFSACGMLGLMASLLRREK